MRTHYAIEYDRRTDAAAQLAAHHHGRHYRPVYGSVWHLSPGESGEVAVHDARLDLQVRVALAFKAAYAGHRCYVGALAYRFCASPRPGLSSHLRTAMALASTPWWAFQIVLEDCTLNPEQRYRIAKDLPPSARRWLTVAAPGLSPKHRTMLAQGD